MTSMTPWWPLSCLFSPTMSRNDISISVLLDTFGQNCPKSRIIKMQFQTSYDDQRSTVITRRSQRSLMTWFEVIKPCRFKKISAYYSIRTEYFRFHSIQRKIQCVSKDTQLCFLIFSVSDLISSHKWPPWPPDDPCLVYFPLPYLEMTFQDAWFLMFFGHFLQFWKGPREMLLKELGVSDLDETKTKWKIMSRSSYESQSLFTLVITD
jgi:hypothetical protein